MKEVYDECKKRKAVIEVDGVVEVTGGMEVIWNWNIHCLHYMHKLHVRAW